MMHRLPLCFALVMAACATTPQTPPDLVAGCWINRDVGVATMRWFEAANGAFNGVRLQYGSPRGPHVTRYQLSPLADGWRLCEANEENITGRCWQVAQGDGGSLDGGRAFIDLAGERLRIAVIGDGPERIVFSGRRDSCD